MKERMRQTKKVRKFTFERFFFFLITIGLYAMCLSSYLKWETTGGTKWGKIIVYLESTINAYPPLT